MLGKVITFRLTVGLLDETETVFENRTFWPPSVKDDVQTYRQF